MKRLVFTLVNALLLVGCSEADQDKLWPRDRFRLESLTVIECRWAEQKACGWSFWDCTNGQRYTCQNNVEEL